MPVSGGAPVQITRNGGGIPAQSLDGRTIFYAKDGSTPESSRLWTVPADGGEERQVLPSVYSHNFAVRQDGIFFIPTPESAIWFLRFADHNKSILATLRSTPGYGMDVSKDGRTALVPEYEEEIGGDIMAIENLR